jgi:peptide/nickel transport system permease protein
MLRYFMQRMALGLAILVVAVSALYAFIVALPGDPTSVLLGPRATDEMRVLFTQRMGLDKPLPMQIVDFWVRVLQGDLGDDVMRNRPVAVPVFNALPYTLILIFSAIAWSATLGVVLGAFSAAYRNSLVDRITGVLSVGMLAAPSFVVALWSLLLFAVTLKWFPAIGVGERGDLPDQLHHLALPAGAIGLGWVGYIARIVRASMLEVLSENHIRTARAFGLPPRRIIYGYALRIAVLPAISVLGVGIGGLLSSAVFAEIVFARPGIGRLIYDSVISRNYPVVTGSMLVAIAFFILCTLAADLANAALDPRLRRKR